MYKNLLKSITFAALALVAGACAKEQVASGDGDTVEATFNVDVPETTITTKGLSDAAQVNELKFQLFIKDGDGYKMVQEQIVPVAEKKAVVKATLVKRQSYAAAFWAQTSGTGFYETTDLRAVKMNIANVKANEPTMDAFWGNENSIIAASGMKPRSVKLHRALAQVNFGTVIPTGADALSITKSQVVMKGVPTTLNVLLGNDDKAHSGSENITFQDNAPISGEKLIIADGGTQYDYVATAYVFAPKSGNLLTDVSAKVTFNNGKSTTISAPNVPICRNFRTNILGNLLSVDGEWNITIDEKFNKGDLFYDPVGSAISKGGEVTLEDDFSVVPNSYGLVISTGVSTVLNLNGKKFENRNGNLNPKAALKVNGGELTINGEGNVYCEKNPAGYIDPNDPSKGVCSNCAIVVTDGGHLIINGGHYSVGTDFFGKCNSTIYVEKNNKTGKSGKVEIYGGTFTNDEGSNGHSFVLNQDDQLTENCITVYGGTFIGFNPADNTSDGEHTNYVAEGYKSVKISESPETWKVEAIPAVTTQEAFASAVTEANATVKLAEGTYTLPSTIGSGVTILGPESGSAVIIDMEDKTVPGYNAVSFKNMSFKVGNADYKGFQHSEKLVFDGCTFEGQVVAYGTPETYKNCTFIQSGDQYCLRIYGSSKTIIQDCKFKNTLGKAILIYKEGTVKKFDVTVDGCNMTADQKISGKTAIQMHTELGISGTLTIKNTTVTGFDSLINGGLWNDINNKTKEPTKKFTVKVDGETVQTAE